MAKVEDRLMDHNFDGIQEYDNPLPPWWVYLFLITVIWGGVFLFYQHIAAIGPSSDEEYMAEIEDYKLEYASIIAAEGSVNWNEPDFQLITEKAKIDKAKVIFMQNCASCHQNEGGGGIGPNLTDEYWIHGGGINEIAKTIALGVPEKGMISWKTSFKKNDILALASLIISFKGTNPPNPKPPQGDIWKDDGAAE